MDNKNLKKIQVPDGLISNQFRKDDVKVSPKITYLYVWLKMLLRNYETSVLEITPIKLKKQVGWKSNHMLKNHLLRLKKLGYISYQDEFDNGELRPHQELCIYIKRITELNVYFKELSEKSIKEKIIPATDKPEKAIRFCYMMKCYTNINYGYCWLTYEQIQKWGNIRLQEQNELGKLLSEKKILYITKGETIKDKAGQIRKENNKYQLLIN